MTILHNPSNYATLNQLCIQAHSSSLRCGGSLCKVQCDQKRKSSLRPPSRSPLRDLEGFKIIQSFAICPIMRFRVGARNDKEQVAPHPSPPRAGEGAITLHNLFNYATLNQLCIQAHSSSLRCGGSLCKVQGDKCGAVNYTQLILLCNYSKISSIY